MCDAAWVLAVVLALVLGFLIGVYVSGKAELGKGLNEELQTENSRLRLELEELQQSKPPA